MPDTGWHLMLGGQNRDICNRLSAGYEIRFNIVVDDMTERPYFVGEAKSRCTDTAVCYDDMKIGCYDDMVLK